MRYGKWRLLETNFESTLNKPETHQRISEKIGLTQNPIMDELLELMNNDYIDDSTLITDRDGDGDDEVKEQRNENVIFSVENHSKKDKGDRDTQKATRTTASDRSAPTIQSSSYLAKASIDDRLDIRMTNRLVSSNDLLELITDYDYHSPSVLSAMTLKRLNSLLQEPSQIIDPATVAGKTESLVTVGIVFSNTGTRISNKGGAFCILTIGNLNSGPCLTILLFGDAYGKYCVSCKPGKVIAVMAPKLLPANRGDTGGNGRSRDADRTVSFSVYNAGQLKIVANARDYTTCKESGCKHYVDRRNSEYCDNHRRQLKQKSKGGKQSLNRFQQVQSVHRQVSGILVDSTTRKRNLIGSSSSKKSNRFLDNTSVINTNLVHSTNPTKMTGATGSKLSNRLLRADVPKHMSKLTNRRTNSHMVNAVKPTKIASVAGLKSSNPYLSASASKRVSNLTDRKSNKGHTAHSSFPSEKKTFAKREDTAVGDNGITATSSVKWPKKAPVAGNWLEQGIAMSKQRGPTSTSGRTGFSLSRFTSKKRSAKPNSNTANARNRNKKRSINTDGEGFNGSVMIPKPSLLFKTSCTSALVTKRIVTPIVGPKAKEELIQRQAELARQIKEGGPRKCEEKGTNSIFSERRIRAPQSKLSSKGSSRKKSTEVDSFLAAMGDIDEEKIRNAKSEFANEVEADEYAKQRRKVDELEKAEASHESRNKKNKSEEKKLSRMWLCKTCGKSYFKTPKACTKAGHEVSRKFAIKDDITKDERRSELNRRNIEDGGLRVGSGIAWSSYGNR